MLQDLKSYFTVRSMAVGLTMVAAAGAIIFTAARLAGFTASVSMYHGIVWAIFFSAYLLIPGGFAAHFNVPDNKQVLGAADVAYYTTVTHSGTGYGDITPKTTLARVLATAHMFMVVLAVFNMVPVGKSTLSFGAFDG